MVIERLAEEVRQEVAQANIFTRELARWYVWNSNVLKTHMIGISGLDHGCFSVYCLSARMIYHML